MSRANIHSRLEKLEAGMPPYRYSEHRERMLDSLDRVAAWKRAGSPDNEEGHYVKELEEHLRRSITLAQGRG